MFSALKTYVAAHKVITVIALILATGGGYWSYMTYASGSEETRYVLSVVERGSIVSSLSASGQIASSDETDIKAKAAGDIVAVSAKAGDRVVQGQGLASVDATEARRAVTDAELAVEEAQLNLEHDTLQAPIDYKSLQESVARAERDLEDVYEDAYVALADAFITLPDVIAGADSILYDNDIDPNSQNVSAYQNLFVSADDDRIVVRGYVNTAEADYKAARDAYTKSAAAFKVLSRSSDSAIIGTVLSDAQDMAGFLSKAVVSETNLIDTVVDILERRDGTIDVAITTAQSGVRSYVTTANNVLTSLTAAEKAIENAEDAVTDAEHALELASVGNPTGDNPFDLKLLQNTLKQKEAALADAKQALADTTIRAPFSGILATFNIRRGESVSNGTSVGTLISDQQIAQLSLNEVDAANVKVGDKATLTFDALEDLTLTGEVAEIDPVGTVSQGVVSYTLKIGFDTQDTRVKPGMTVNAAIIVDTKHDALVVPSSAIKTSSGVSYVQVFNPALPSTGGTQGVASDIPPQQVEVELGISDDTNVEILSGLTEGQQIVVRTVSGTAETTTTSTGNARGGFGGPGGGIRL